MNTENEYYQIDELGKMLHLSNLSCFCSSSLYEFLNYKVFICINSFNKKTAQSLHYYIFSVLDEISALDKKAKTKLKELYNLTDNELSEVTIETIDFDVNKDFSLLYALPKNLPFEYLSIKFNSMRIIIDSSGGNF